MKSLDEQIEYMGFEVDWNKDKIARSKLGESLWSGDLEMSQAILGTLIQLKELGIKNELLREYCRPVDISAAENDGRWPMTRPPRTRS